jgi:hypothetical protein
MKSLSEDYLEFRLRFEPRTEMCYRLKQTNILDIFMQK